MVEKWHVATSEQKIQEHIYFQAQQTLWDYFEHWYHIVPYKVLVVEGQHRITFQEMKKKVLTLSAALRQLGLSKGEVVSIQLPNWYEYLVWHLALTRLGLITNPIPHHYRNHEIVKMAGKLGSVAIVVPYQFNNHNYLEMVRQLRKQLTSIKFCFILRENENDQLQLRGKSGELSYDKITSSISQQHILQEERFSVALLPNEVTTVLFTSGTTGEPKGVMHTSQTSNYFILSKAIFFDLTENDVLFMASPLGHSTGFKEAVRGAVILGQKVVLLDRWDSTEALKLLKKERCTWSMGATPFLIDLVNSMKKDPKHLPNFRLYVCGGAQIPRSLVNEAKQLLGCHVTGGWGGTEGGAMTGCKEDDPLEKIVSTDGRPYPGMQLKIVNGEGNELPSGSEGEIYSKSPSLFVGYYGLEEATCKAFTNDGWFKSGDCGILDKDGYLIVTGRLKDIIIRGGVNLPVVEIEEILFQHPKIKEVAIVAMPDERLQEKACAYVVPRSEDFFTFEEMIEYLRSLNLAVQKFPERLEIVESLPKTPSGKIQKYILREDVKQKLMRERGEI